MLAWKTLGTSFLEAQKAANKQQLLQMLNTKQTPTQANHSCHQQNHPFYTLLQAYACEMSDLAQPYKAR